MRTVELFFSLALAKLANALYCTEAEHCRKIVAYHDERSCGFLGGDYNWEICGWKDGNCPDVIYTDLCESGEAYRNWMSWWHWIGDCKYRWYVEYFCKDPIIEIQNECVPVAMTVKAEFTEHSVNEVSKTRKVVESSNEFNKVAKTDKIAVESSIGFKLLTASLKTEWTKSIEETSQVEGSREEFDQSTTVFKEGFLQIKRTVTRTVRIGSNSAKVEEVKYVDSVPIDENQTPEQLNECAGKYIEAEYGHKQNDNAKIVGKYGNIFEMESKCPVWCGGHHAPSCSECPHGNDGEWHNEGWCNGECIWSNNECILRF